MSTVLTFDGPVRFISDLHLQAGQPAVNQRFARFLDDCAANQIAALFILGDLFEYWVGDDAQSDPFNDWVCAQLKQLADAGTALYFLHGNRDFLIGARMAKRCGLTLLPEVVQVGAGKTATLLMHGDTLCTDDADYQNFRAMVRAPDWQAAFLARPLTDRLAEVSVLRERSRQAMRNKRADIMDANPDAIVAALRQSGCTRLIHGHTHRPGKDRYSIDNHICERWVLSDWTDTRGDAIEVTCGGISRIPLIS